MKREKAHKLLDKIIDGTFERAWDNANTVGYQDGYDDGVMAHKQMIRNRIELHLEYCMDNNKMSEAKFTKEMLSYLMYEYDPEKAEKELREQEANEDGFGIIF
jgi:hypothetical protein